jgi:hypothetical protein
MLSRDPIVAKDIMEEFAADLATLTAVNADHEGFKALNGDVNGRMLESIDGDSRFNRWGKHYLRAITRSH